tara:strand:- start:7667 stop:7954 length:288 start_codon:yes stop_codon:yes gene_type:complete
LSSRRNIEVGPIRWKFIKSASPREPYKNIKKLYEVELSNLRIKNISDLDKDEILKIRARTKSVLKKKYRKELIQNISSLSVIIISAIILVWFLVK